MIVAMQGQTGAGKTLVSSVLALALGKALNLPVFANYELVGAQYIDSLDDMMKLRNCIIVYDEMHKDADSRDFKFNKIFTHWLNENRKFNILVFYTTQEMDQVDIRIRRRTHFVASMTKIKDGVHKMLMQEAGSKSLGRYITLQNLDQFYGVYNTHQSTKSLKTA